jgi:BirA family biotin operon repressor/biotin-[acetyl-CoA-carboxylase] ligase
MSYTQTIFGDYTILNHEILDSTNLEAKRIIDKNPNANNFVVTALNQTAGRGRSGKEWVSDEGNLFFSIILDGRKFANPAELSIVSAFVLYKIFRSYNLDAKIKWPNDIYINQMKISGILLEKHKENIIIGVGVNVVSHPEYIENSIAKSATNLHDLKVEISPLELLQDYLHEFEDMMEIYTAYGISFSEQNLQDIFYNFGKEIKINIAGEVITGQFVNLNSKCELILKTSDSIKNISMGEVLYA